jgi:(E)-4-hydroxy-3-methylbut-2-enyl-diphosphate synthase
MKRFKTREVRIGRVVIGGNNFIAIQSMTNTDTLDIVKTADQIMRLENFGCDIVRLTIQGVKEVQACEKIRNNLIKRGCNIPLVADIHFFPKVANGVIDFVDKIRINPGNFVKQPVGDNDVLFKVEEKLLSLIDKCKKQNKALRIGVNHGSLSERILHLYGNTPKAMVISAFEYADICRKYDFHELVFSMKASNPSIMIESYRMLISEMIQRGFDYPIHLGVTEAGEGEEGIIKSAIGIGPLLLEGIGDTIRVSLTDEPEKEIAPAKKLIEFSCSMVDEDSYFLPQERREKRKLSYLKNSFPIFLTQDERDSNTNSLDQIDGLLFERSKIILPFDSSSPICSIEKLEKEIPPSSFSLDLTDRDFKDIDKKLEKLDPDLIFFSPEKDRVNRTRELAHNLFEKRKKGLLIASFSYFGEKERIFIEASTEIGGLIIDGVVDGVCFDANLPFEERKSFLLSLLQSCGKGYFKAEYISCPGCGRTLYDIQKVTKSIKAKTFHLKGVKIAIMGCKVNGLGEMADADFGFVGSGKNKVDLYVGKRVVEKNIDFLLAEEKLIDLIKIEGRWIENYLWQEGQK